MSKLPFSQKTYRERRDALALDLSEHPSTKAAGGGFAAVLMAVPTAIRNQDVEHPFRADSDIAYLTGFEEPDCAVVVVGTAESYRTVLFVRPRDRTREIWTGRRAGVEGARDIYGADEAYPIGELARRLPDLLWDRSVVFSLLGRTPEHDATVVSSIETVRARCRKKGRYPQGVLDLRDVLWRQRQVKSDDEIEKLERASEASVLGHRVAMAKCRPGVNEADLEAELSYAFKLAGAKRHGYNPIVASGENACILHYEENDRQIQAGDLVLIDAGGEVDLYTADITRTFPASGKFTKPQREIYEVVLTAQEAAIAAAKPGVTLDGIDDVARRRLAEGLIALGLLEGTVEDAVRWKRSDDDAPWVRGTCPLMRYYMHGTGHLLGLDVHDVGFTHDGVEPTALTPGMVFTVEPGIYIAPDDDDAPEAYRGIGVRIEDDVLITADGCRVLTEGAPKSVDEIEALVGTDTDD